VPLQWNKIAAEEYSRGEALQHSNNQVFELLRHLIALIFGEDKNINVYKNVRIK
jgi:hypothetical protein